jgi:hypothetical protein
VSTFDIRSEMSHDCWDFPPSISKEASSFQSLGVGDPSGKHVRLDVNSVLKDASGAYISYKYSGIIDMKPGPTAVLTGSSDAKTTDVCKCPGTMEKPARLKAHLRI